MNNNKDNKEPLDVIEEQISDIPEVPLPSDEADTTPEELVQVLVKDNEALRKEMDASKDQLLRLAAEMENLRRRTERDIKDARQFSISNFARDLLSISDNLDRALASVSEEDKAENHAGLMSLLQGVEMTSRELNKVMTKHGVSREMPEGEKFDPNRHQAMFEVPNKDMPTGTIVQVIQAGYSLSERILRPAMVGVSSGGPKQKAKEQASKDVTSES